MITLIWILSLIVLVASSVFVYKMLITSSELISTDKRVVSKLSRINTRDKLLRQSLDDLNSKMKTLEDANSYYVMQFTRLQQQLEESSGSQTVERPKGNGVVSVREEEEDWEELYYQENEKKVQLENELDVLRQELDVSDKKFADLQKKNQELAFSKSDHDFRLNEITSLENEIETLRKKLNASLNRERELTVQIQNEISQKNALAKTQSDNTRLQSEIADQRRQLTHMYQKEQETSVKLAQFGELESKIALYEDEQKLSIRKLENRLNQNKVFTDYR